MLPQADLDHCFAGVGALWERFRGQRLFVTGGSGIIGKWLLESLFDADRRLGLDVSVVTLSRDPARFATVAPHLAGAAGHMLIEGDVRTFVFPEGRFDMVVLGATDVVAASPPLDVFDTCVAGTRRTLDLAARSGAREALLLSSGAVYGPQPPDVETMPETFEGGPDPLRIGSAYGEGKRAAEWLGAAYSEAGQVAVKSARCYAMVGPYLPVDKHFAIGNFMRDALQAEPIRILGDGTTTRSYLHIADVTIWLWTILLNGRPATAYNVGSDQPVTMRELAGRIAALAESGAGVEVIGQRGGRIDRYVPETRRAREELGLRAAIGLDDAIARTMDWHRAVAGVSG